jgi:hypothetical protein
VSRATSDTLLESADWLVSFAGDKVATRLRDSGYKGAAEAFMLAAAMSWLKDADFPVLFKLSGRYQLSDRFEMSRFPASGFGVHVSGGVPSTRLYSVGRGSGDRYARQLLRGLWRTSRGCSMEQALFRGVPHGEFHRMDVVGVTGLVAVTGDVIDE